MIGRGWSGPERGRQAGPARRIAAMNRSAERPQEVDVALGTDFGQPEPLEVRLVPELPAVTGSTGDLRMIAPEGPAGSRIGGGGPRRTPVIPHELRARAGSCPALLPMAASCTSSAALNPLAPPLPRSACRIGSSCAGNRPGLDGSPHQVDPERSNSPGAHPGEFGLVGVLSGDHAIELVRPRARQPDAERRTVRTER